MRKGVIPRMAKDLCLREVGLRVQNMITILGILVDMILRPGGGNLYDYLMSTRIITLIMNNIFI